MRHCACWTTEAFGGSRNSYSRVLHSSLMSSTTIDPSRHKHGCLLQPSRSGISLLFPSSFFFFYVCCRNATLSNSVAKKTSIQCLQHTVSRTARACAEPDNIFFFGPNYFFSPSRVAFGVLMWRETKKITTVALCFSLCCFFAEIMLKNMLFALHYSKFCLIMLCTRSSCPSAQQARTSACFAEIHI